MQPEAACKDKKETQTAALSLSAVIILTVALLLGRAALLSDSQDLLGNTSTWTALTIFLMIGALVLRFDFVEMAKEEAKKEGVHYEPGTTWWLWLTAALLLTAAVAWTEMPAGFYAAPSSTAVANQGSTVSWVDPKLMEELHSRALKLKGAPQDMENTIGRDLDASLVGQTGVPTGLPAAARRCARKEITALAHAAPATCVPATAAHRWHASVQLLDEITIFLLTAALAIGLAACISDVREMAQEQQEEAAFGSVGGFPDAEKKPSTSRSYWRLYVCIALLVAAAASFAASFFEGM
jgi:hypothetical protein